VVAAPAIFTPRPYQLASFEATQRALLCDRECVPAIELPTGAGKSWVLAMLAQWAVKPELSGRVLLIAHRKELLAQNGEKIEQLTGKEVGYVSAGLRREDYDHQIICAGVQTLYRRLDEVGERNLILVDEAHLISDDELSMFRQCIEAFPNARVVGLTATPYRTGTGSIVDNGIFTSIVYRANVRELINKGYLSRLTTTPTSVSISSQGLQTSRGEYLASQQAERFLSQLTETCAEIVAATADRKAVLVFCVTVEHAEQVRDELENLTGERVGLVTGHTIALERASTLHAFQSGDIQICVNVSVLTTGYDNPRIDAICILRCTKSPGLNAQICGRGFRIAQGKDDCLILDFGKNIERHGPLDSKWYGQIEYCRGGDGESPLKICPNCEATNHAAVKVCEDCGLEFVSKETVKPNHGTHYERDANILTNGDEKNKSDRKKYYVETITYRRHGKTGAPESVTLCVSYLATPVDVKPGNIFGSKMISEYVCFEHEGFARTKAEQWWTMRSHAEVPDTVDEAIDAINSNVIRTPSHFTATQDGRFYRITELIFPDERPEPVEWHDMSFHESDVPF
jgi:DNA repair protein RadD